VTATFGNGQTRVVYEGVLPAAFDQHRLPGRERFVRELNFDCRSATPRGANVDIAADIGRFARVAAKPGLGSRLVADVQLARQRPALPGQSRNDRFITGSLDTSDWINLGSRSFEGTFDREVAFAGLPA